MKIGVVSDTHGRAGRLAAAIEVFAVRGAQAVVHCGDIGSTECVELLGASGMSAYAVAGNMDRHADRLAETAERAGVHFATEIVEVPLEDGQHLVAMHGHDEAVLSEMILGGQFPYVCHGHTHRARDERIGAARVVNPGALAHPRDPRHPTAAVLDTRAGTVEFVTIPR